MLYNLFCDAEWKEPISLDTESILQIGHAVYLMDAENEGRSYRVTEIEHIAMRDGLPDGNWEASSILNATVVRISDAELDQGHQTGCATT